MGERRGQENKSKERGNEGKDGRYDSNKEKGRAVYDSIGEGVRKRLLIGK